MGPSNGFALRSSKLWEFTSLVSCRWFPLRSSDLKLSSLSTNWLENRETSVNIACYSFRRSETILSRSLNLFISPIYSVIFNLVLILSIYPKLAFNVASNRNHSRYLFFKYLFTLYECKFLLIITLECSKSLF